jgi:phosphatidate cytidylyltransferase
MAGSWRELGLRIASAIVLVPLAIATAYAGGWWFVAFWGVAAIGVSWELGKLFDGCDLSRLVNTTALALGAMLLGISRFDWALALLTLGALLATALAGPGRWAPTLAGAALPAALVAAPVALRADGAWGFLAISLIFAVVWTTDVMAYFVGRLLAGPKLWPAISPNKTWSGAIAGMLSGTAAGVGVAAFAKLNHLMMLAIVCGGLAFLAEAGDLAESALKRRFGAKDASHLIPGHGGLMDRLDSFLPAAVGATLLGLVHSSGDTAARGLLLW